MPDPFTVSAVVGWGVSAVGWLASPIISRVLNKGFTHLDYNAAEKLKILDIQVLHLQRVMEVLDESTYRVRLEPLLNKLRSALYEAEDILDDVEYQRLKKQIQDSKSDSSRVDSLRRNLRSAMPTSPLKDKDSGLPKLQLEKSLTKIESAISLACEVLEQLGLPGVSNDNGKRAVSTNSRRAVTTAGPPARVIGRDQDREKIIAMLHEKEDPCQANTVCGTCYSVIGIHGIAGSGKTTLAQCVYDREKKYRQEKMEGHFDLVIWIHVSQKFDLDSIFREMFEGATRKACDNFNSRNVLKENLEEELCGKRILLVLDDVWYNSRNVKDNEELQQILAPLNVGNAGSRILVTSRTEDALLAMGAVKERCIPISDLDDEAFLEMFMYYALGDAMVGGHDRRKLQMVGDIAKKLKGSPLAARTVGARLRRNPKIKIWMREKDRDLMSETMGALWWSYQYFDEQVRRCFAYYSIFPRRHHLKRDELVKLWVAEGFIKTSNAEEEMEDVAQEYFDELLSASFLQLGGKEEVIGGREVDYFTIHDLLCDLAEEVAGRDCFRIEKGFTGEIPQDVRYLFVGTYSIKMLTEKISRLQNLRTLIFNDRILVKPNEDLESMFTMLTRLRKLRVLNMKIRAGESGHFKLSFPDSGQLKHLRYFAFLPPAFHKLTIPGAFTKLYHMQVVDFGLCINLAFPSVEDMMNLVNLRCIISKADLEFPNVGRLTWLQMLPFFTIKKKQGYESHQLKHLNKLRGKLQIHGLENVQTKEEAVEVNLARKERLAELVLHWDYKTCSPEVQAEVLDGLCPSKYLEKLEICGYYGVRSPNWMMGRHNSGEKNLQELRFSGCSQLGPAPDLDAFIHLHALCLHSCSWDALPSNMEQLTLLKKLEVTNWENIRAFPTLAKSLEEFIVMNCSCDALPGNMEHLTSLRKLRIELCKNIRSLPTLPESLEEFRVTGCSWDALQGNMEHLTKLKKLEIQSCMNMRLLGTLPKSLEEFIVETCSCDALLGNMEHLKMLRKLRIESCKNIRSLPTLPESLEEFIVVNCSCDALPGNMEYLRSLRKLRIESCRNMRLLGTLPESLEKFTVMSCSCDALPGNMEHLTSLRKLRIELCKNIRSLPTLPESPEEFIVMGCSWDALQGNMEHLTKLKELEIHSCMNMRLLGTLPNSLEEFTVQCCTQEFMRSCITIGDPNWQKIEHIPKKTFETFDHFQGWVPFC